MGTVISLHHLEAIEAMIKRRKSGNILAGGERMIGRSSLDGFDFSRGCFFPPTVIGDVSTTDELWREEVFGPVVVVKRFSVSHKHNVTCGVFIKCHFLMQSEKEGIDLANDCKYGLGAGIWTLDVSKAHRVASEIESGLCWVNTHHRNDPSSPW